MFGYENRGGSDYRTRSARVEREKGREGRSVFSVQYVLVWKWPYVTQSIYSEYT